MFKDKIKKMSDLEIKNKVAESGLINFDLSQLVPKGKRIGIDLKDFLFQELILKEKDFREKVAAIKVSNDDHVCASLLTFLHLCL